MTAVHFTTSTMAELCCSPTTPEALTSVALARSHVKPLALRDHPPLQGALHYDYHVVVGDGRHVRVRIALSGGCLAGGTAPADGGSQEGGVNGSP